jgi:hypothetical protein
VVEQFSAEVSAERDAGNAATRPAPALVRWLALEPGFYQVRVAAVGARAEEVGSAFDAVEMPDLTRPGLALSSLFLSPAREDAPASREPVRARPRGGQPWRRLPAGSDVDAVVFAYNARVDESGGTDLTVRFRLLSGGRLLHDFEPRPLPRDAEGAPARVPGGARLSLESLPPGEYELQAIVEDRRAGARAERSAGFAIAAAGRLP